jgi:hypothetical protein
MASTPVLDRELSLEGDSSALVRRVGRSFVPVWRIPF